MKCIKNGSGNIRRVSDQEAEQLVYGYRIEKNKRIPAATGGWSFCSKTEWKNEKNGRSKAENDLLEHMHSDLPAPEEAPKKAKKPRGKKAEKAAVRKAEKAAIAAATES